MQYHLTHHIVSQALVNQSKSMCRDAVQYTINHVRYNWIIIDHMRITKEKMNCLIHFDGRRWHVLLLQYGVLLSKCSSHLLDPFIHVIMSLISAILLSSRGRNLP